MPVANEHAACVNATAASLADISSRAWNRLATRYLRPVMSPATTGSTDVASFVAGIMAAGFNLGIKVVAVSTLRVLAGPYSPCGSLAASTCPVPALATSQAEAGTSGSFRPSRAGLATTTPGPAIKGPPTSRAAIDPGAGTPAAPGPLASAIAPISAALAPGPASTAGQAAAASAASPT